MRCCNSVSDRSASTATGDGAAITIRSSAIR